MVSYNYLYLLRYDFFKPIHNIYIKKLKNKQFNTGRIPRRCETAAVEEKHTSSASWRCKAPLEALTSMFFLDFLT
jgi:hypothetical protein